MQLLPIQRTTTDAEVLASTSPSSTTALAAAELGSRREPNHQPNFVVDPDGPNVVIQHDVVLRGNVVMGPDTVDAGPSDPPQLPGAPSRLPRVSVIVPTFNEAKNLPHVFGRIPDDVHEVIVVDGRSVDDTVEVARSLRPGVRIVLQNRRGKGNAMACGFAAATGDILVMLDADGSADPQEIPRFVAALVGGADFAKGTRFAPGGGSDDITAVRAWGNGWLNRMANALFSTRYTDLCYGYNAFWRRCLVRLELDPRTDMGGDKLWGDGFEIETIINTRMAKAGMKITEVPSHEFRRIHGESNLNTWRDGGRVLRALLIERFNRAGRRPAGSSPSPEVSYPAVCAVVDLEDAQEVRSA